MEPGKFRQRISLQIMQNGVGQLGEPLPLIPMTVATVSAKAEVISNRKIRTMDQKQVIETWLFTIRPRRDVQPDWRIAWEDNVYTVRAVDCSMPDRVVITAERDNRND